MSIEVFELARIWKEQAKADKKKNAQITSSFLNWSIEFQGSAKYSDEFILWIVERYPNYKEVFCFEDPHFDDLWDLYLHFNPF